MKQRLGLVAGLLFGLVSACTAQVGNPGDAPYEMNTRAMATPQMIGDCNSCHTQDGANMAPGRIMAP